MRHLHEVFNLGFRAPAAVSGSAEISPSAFELLPRTKWSLKEKVRWYVSLRYWKQAVAVVTIYTGVLSAWAYLVR
jgi:hypothetical protein